MKNFPFKHDGQTFWYQRGIVCAVFIFAANKEGDLHVLANKRGKAVIESGYWNCPCGHLDFNETCLDCATRETFEETGVKINQKDLTLFTINDKDFKSKDQSIGFIYYALIQNKTIEDMQPNMKHMEKDEVDEVAWIDVDKLKDYKWTFNHDNRIKEILKILV